MPALYIHTNIIYINIHTCILTQEYSDYGHGSSQEREKMRVVYRTPAFPQLRGHCFVGLYETGALVVFAGHPAMPGSRPLWNTDMENQPTPNDAAVVRDHTYFAFMFVSVLVFINV